MTSQNPQSNRLTAQGGNNGQAEAAPAAPRPAALQLPEGQWPDKTGKDRRDEVNSVLKKLYAGDDNAINDLRRLLREVRQLKNYLRGRPDWELEHRLIHNLVDGHPLRAAATGAHVDQLHERLPDWPDDARYDLLGERLINTWLEVQQADRLAAELQPDDERREEVFAQQERAHRRHLAILQTSLKK